MNPGKKKETRRQIVFMLLSLIVIFIFTYVVGSPLLTSFPLGSDTPSHLAKVYYLDQYYPHFPSWYYKEGSGYPFLMMYSPLSYYITFFLHKLFSISIFEAFNLTWFSSMLLGGIAVYFFARVKFRNELVALSSSVFYLSYPLIWLMQTVGGFFTETVAIPFSILTLTFFTLYQDRRSKKYFICAVWLYTFTILAHAMIGLVTTIVLVVYSVSRFLAKEISLKDSIFVSAKMIAFGLGLSSFWLIPFIVASPLTTYAQTTLREPADILYFAGILPAILGFVGETGGIFGYSSHSIAMSVFFLFGVISAVKKRGFSFWALLLNVILVAFLFEYLFFQVKAVLGPILRFNFLIVIFLSSLAGLGVAEICGLPTRIHLFCKSELQRRGMKQLQRLINTAPSIALIVLVFCISLGHIYNPTGWGGFPMPAFVAETNYNMARKLSSQLKEDVLTRIDVSPNLGGIMEALPLVSDVSQVNTYFFQGSLFRPWWGYQAGVFYGPIGGKTELRALARWFGVEYVVISYSEDPVWKYENNNFTEVWHEGVIRLLRYDDATGLISVGNQSAVLFIGSEKLNAYEQVFRVLVMSGMDPEDAYLVHGSSYVDDYSLDELKKFDVLVLHGYDYHDSTVAWGLLRNYVADGGRLLIETGWQYTNPDWSNPNIPEPCPVKMTAWTNYGKEWHFSYTNTSIGNQIDFGSFSPPIWGEGPWSFSISDNQSVRNWAFPVLWNSGRPIIVAGNYGKGRVVWSGMNLIPHANGNENHEECRFFGRLLEWLIGRGPVTNFEHNVVRNIPEEVAISIVNADRRTNVLFREAYFHDWQAYIQKEGVQTPVKIYKAGPDLMLVRVPPEMDPPFNVVFTYKRSIVEWGGISITVVSLLVLIVYGMRRGTRGTYDYPKKGSSSRG